MFILLNSTRKVEYRPYTLLGTQKKVYYEIDPKRLPHQGQKECLRRVRQKYAKSGSSLRYMLAQHRYANVYSEMSN